MTTKLLMGNEAFAHAALEAGVRVVAGYPGTPSSELVETVAKLHAEGAAQGVHVEWSTNEKAALELAAGASHAGARVLFTCKQVGLNVASDALMSLNYVGTNGGTVLFVADDPGPISSQTEQDTRRFASFAKVPVLDPATPDQGFAMMQVAFDLSERYHTPVIVRPTTRVCHASTFFDVADTTEARPVPEEGFQKDPKWVIFPRRAYQGHGEINERLVKIADDFSTDPAFEQFNPVFTGGMTREMPQIGIMAGGVSAAYVREALAIVEDAASAAGVLIPAYRFMQVGTPYPFPEKAAAVFARGLRSVVVVEELDSVLEDEMLKLAAKIALDSAKTLGEDIAPALLEVLGRYTGHMPDRGENTIDDIALRLAKLLLSERYAQAADDDSRNAIEAVFATLEEAASGTRFAELNASLPVRPPVLCPGCPHRGSFYAIKRALGKQPAVMCGDIGCYTLGNAQPLDAVDTCLCMGAGITMAQGLAVAEPHKKQVAFVGDSTFFASGLTGIANAVYNGHDITVAVLDNATTAMTGSQPHPGTGVTLMGEKRKPIDIEGVLRALGVECIERANPLDLRECEAAAKRAIEFEGPSALLLVSPCIQLVKPSPAVTVDTETCTGCKKCITEIGCPAIGFDPAARGPRSKERGQVFVDASQCNGCNLCTQVCPFGSLIEGGCRD
ncbi:MAG: 4Fe-4S binding protein [Eggerthellaceae bacterium]|nr:4Fe-4S binding protein [Eggerthellaceae bacterium]